MSRLADRTKGFTFHTSNFTLHTSPSVPASRSHTAIHGVRLCLRLGVHDRRVAALPSPQRVPTTATGQSASSRELRQRPLSAAGELLWLTLEHLSRPPTLPGKTFRWHRAIGLQFDHCLKGQPCVIQSSTDFPTDVINSTSITPASTT